MPKIKITIAWGFQKRTKNRKAGEAKDKWL